MERLSLDLEPVPPFRLDLTVWTLRRRPDKVVDRWDGTTYRRVLVADDSEPFEVAVTQTGLPDAPRLCVSVNYRKSNDIIKRHNKTPSCFHTRTFVGNQFESRWFLSHR